MGRRVPRITSKNHLKMAKRFKEYSGLNLPAINKEVLSKWGDEDVFNRTMSEREGCPSFVFFEGPP